MLRPAACNGVLYDDEARVFIFNIKDKATLEKMTATIPLCNSKRYQDGWLVSLPMADDTVRILHNMGLPILGLEPFHYEYTLPKIEGRFSPLKSQCTTAAFLAAMPRAYCTSTMRVGKTGAATMCCDYLQESGKSTGATLIIAPLSTLRGVWLHTIATTLPHKKAVMLHGSRSQRQTLLSQPADFFIINYDGIELLEKELTTMVKQHQITTIVVDELTHYGNTQTKRFKSLYRIVNSTSNLPYLYGITGSPGTDPIPVFGFAKLVNPIKLPCKYVTAWREMTQYHYGQATWQWTNKPDAINHIHAVMQPNIRFDKKDIFDLPPVVKQTRTCELSADQARVYKSVKNDMVAFYKENTVIEAVHAAALTSKLFQIALGSVNDKSGELVDLKPTNRYNVLLDIINEASAKSVVFCHFTSALHETKRFLEKSGLSVALVDGGVTGETRAQIFHDFQHKKDPQVIVCQPRTTAFGVELSAADTIIFNGPPLSGGFVFEQALERLSSLKQKADHVNVVYLAGSEEELKFFNGLDKGVKTNMIINDLFASLAKEKA